MKLIKYDIEQLKTKQGQKKYLLQQMMSVKMAFKF